jgi:hypothetical protein
LGCHECSLGDDVQIVRLTGGPHTVLICFQFIQNRLNFKNSKWVPYLAPKIPNFLYAARLGYYKQFFQLC